MQSKKYWKCSTKETHFTLLTKSLTYFYTPFKVFYPSISKSILHIKNRREHVNAKHEKRKGSAASSLENVDEEKEFQLNNRWWKDTENQYKIWHSENIWGKKRCQLSWEKSDSTCLKSITYIKQESFKRQ